MLNSPITAMVQPPTAGRQPAIDQIGRQMHGDEEELKAAGEVAEHQQHVAAVAERFRQRLRRRFGLRHRGRRRARRLRRRGEHERQRQDQQQDDGEHQQRVLPADIVDQADGERREQELAERAGRGAGAEADGAPLRRQQLGERADHQRERAAGEAEADQHAGRHVELERALRRMPSRRCRRRRAARRRPARAARRSGRRARRRTAGPRPTAASRSPARARTGRGPSRSRRPSA